MACGRLFEGVAKSEGFNSIPTEITNNLGKSPHEYFLARMDLVSRSNNQQEKGDRRMVEEPRMKEL